MDYVEQESLQPKQPLQDPPLRNGMFFRKPLAKTESSEAIIITWSEIQGNPTDSQSLLAAFGNLQTALGYNPLNPARNLSELTDPAAAVENLGLNRGGANDVWLSRFGGIMEGLIILNLAAALQFQGNTNLTTPGKGFMDFDSHQLLFVKGATRRPFSFISDPIVAPVTVQNTTTETAIYSATLEENILAIGNIIRACLYGRYSNTDGTSTFTLRLKVAGTTILSIVSTAAAATNAPVFVEFMNTVQTLGASGTLWSYIRGLINNVNKDKPGTSAASIDTTAPIVISATVQWSAADAGNVFKMDQALLNLN